MGAPVTHFEINAKEPKKLQDFYGKLFDWHMDTNNPMGYAMIDTHADKHGIGGGIGQARDGRSFVTVYVETNDLKGTLAKAEKLGARTLMQPTQSGPVEGALSARCFKLVQFTDFPTVAKTEPQCRSTIAPAYLGAAGRQHLHAQRRSKGTLWESLAFVSGSDVTPELGRLANEATERLLKR